PLNDRIRIGGDRYRVIGVMEPKGDMLGIDLDDTVYIPAASGLTLFNREGLHEIDILYEETAPVDEVVAGIARILIARHGGEDF
ncbi:MAG: ABC transporter permease, partial [Gammaproteobacteria bacterium]|nr:ABC transporter permease [Gammaproteobacteria bacterium]